jgi:hypothetical protein
MASHHIKTIMALAKPWRLTGGSQREAGLNVM